MKCDCVSMVEDEMSKAGFEDANIVDVGFVQVGNKLEHVTLSNVKYKDGQTPSGKDRIKKICLHHSYCPFCGTKMLDDAEPVKE